MTFPVTVEFKKLEAKIYRPAKNFPFYRVALLVDGKRKMMTFASYGEAKTAAEKKLREIHKGHKAAAMTACQSRDALFALELLQGFFKTTGKRFSLKTAVGDFLDAVGRLNVPLSAAVDGYLNAVTTIKRVEVKSAVNDFVAEYEAKTKSTNGKRPELSMSYFSNTKLWLGWFEKTFPATAVCDLSKDHLDLFMAGRSHLAAKSKNHLRATVKMFLNWCIRKDFISQTHRLMEA
ncbi:MAG: hypothetical protein WCS42_13175, partial [Verrucomicrobiota bacterium]